MTRFRFLTSLAVAGVVFLFALNPQVFGQRRPGRQSSPYDRARSLVSQVQSDLQRSQRSNRASSKERERYDNAMGHLSRFDHELAANRFNKELLDGAIDDVNNVVRNNTLTPRDRDRLSQDVGQLRSLRTNRGMSY